MVINSFLAVLAGVSIVSARMINAKLGERIGFLQSTLANYVTGLIGSVLAFLLFSRQFITADLSLSDTPWFFGGALGVLVVWISTMLVPRMPAYILTLLSFLAQLITGIVIDFFISGIVSPGKIIGTLLIAAGLVVGIQK